MGTLVFAPTKLQTLLTIGAAAFSITTMTAPSSAQACGSAIDDEVDYDTRMLSLAQYALERNDYAEARRLTALVMTTSERAERIEALSYVRDEHASLRHLGESALTLRRINRQRNEWDVVTKVELGEALARLPGGNPEARRLLEPLAKQDLIGSPHAYAALSRIGSSVRIRAEAFQSCDAMALDKSLCTDGFVKEREYEGDHETRDRWAPRMFGALIGVTAIAMMLAAVLCARRRRQRRSSIPLRVSPPDPRISSSMAAVHAECT